MFSKKSADEPQAPAPRPTRTRMVGSNSTFSVIGSDVTITGNVQASVDLHVDGTIEGDISCASLVQGPDSMVKGAIVADTARLAGRVEGSIRAKELVVLKTAKIQGDVHYDALTIEQGTEVEGRFAHIAPEAVVKPAADRRASDKKPITLEKTEQQQPLTLTETV